MPGTPCPGLSPLNDQLWIWARRCPCTVAGRVCVCVCGYTHTETRFYVYLSISLSTYPRVYVCVCMCVYSCLIVPQAHTHTHTHKRAHTHVLTHANTHTHLFADPWASEFTWKVCLVHELLDVWGKPVSFSILLFRANAADKQITSFTYFAFFFRYIKSHLSYCR